ncbi:g1481 [Coccomyxa viridis]|uniref:G1481 protein n=1 Tax=Coccomyxa viridis TaxID=1274662 RepID=A0ABP1FJQ4_9CHLO
MPALAVGLGKFGSLVRLRYNVTLSKAAGKDSTTLVCPLCAKAVKLIPGQDPNAAFEAHTSKDCDPSNYARVHRKLKCPVPGCKEKLTSINTYSCRSCSTDVCLKHRFPSDHACDARKVSQQQPPTSIMRSLLGMGSAKAAPAAETARKSASQQKPAAVPARASASTAARAAAEAAERRRQSSSQPLTALTGAQQAAASQPASERCPQCGNSFRTLQELLFHVEAYHPDGTASSGVEQCPHCGQSFANAVTLVEHVERNHARKELCVLC